MATFVSAHKMLTSWKWINFEPSTQQKFFVKIKKFKQKKIIFAKNTYTKVIANNYNLFQISK